MFYESDEIDEVLKCPFCSTKYTGVIKIIPECGESICGDCYEDLRINCDASEMFECNACDGSHEMFDEEFPDNKSLSRLLQTQRREKPLSDQAQLLKDQLKVVQDELERLKSFQHSEVVNTFCDDLECQVHEACDSAINQINQINQDLLKEINDYRTKCLESCSGSLSISPQSASCQSEDENADLRLSDLDRQISAFGNKWDSFFNRMDVLTTEDDINSSLGQVHKFGNRMRLLQNVMTMKAFDRSVLVFKPHQDLLENNKCLKEFFNFNLHRKSMEVLKAKETPSCTFTGHSAVVNQVLYLPDGRVASCSDDKTIKVWNSTDGTEVYELKGHTGRVFCLTMLQNGWLASGAGDKTIKIWDLNERTEVKTLEGNASSIVSFQVLKNGNLASYSTDDTIRIWNPLLASGYLLTTISGHENRKWKIPFAILSNDYLVTIACDSESNPECVIRVWDPSNGQMVNAISTGLTNAWSILALSNDQIAVGFYNGTIKLISWTDDAKSRTKKEAHSSSVSAFAQLSNGYLLSAGSDASPKGFNIKMWDIGDFSLLQTFTTGHSDAVKSLSLSADKTLLASAGRDSKIKLWPIVSATN